MHPTSNKRPLTYPLTYTQHPSRIAEAVQARGGSRGCVFSPVVAAYNRGGLRGSGADQGSRFEYQGA